MVLFISKISSTKLIMSTDTDRKNPPPSQLPPSQFIHSQLPPSQFIPSQLPPSQNSGISMAASVISSLTVETTDKSTMQSSSQCIINIVTVPSSIYTDGSCVDKYGGYGVVLVKSDGTDEHSGPTPFHPATNNSSELFAIQYALDLIKEKSLKNVTIYSDSQYSIKSLTIWVKTWSRNGWKTSAGKKVMNRDMIEPMFNQLKALEHEGFTIEFQHVYGHQGDEHNETADYLASKGRKNYV